MTRSKAAYSMIAIRTTKCFPLVFGRTINLNVSIQVTDRVFKATGLRLTVHQFGHVAAAIFIKAYPGQYERARQLLGHKHIATTMRFYVALETTFANEAFNDIIKK